MLRKTLGWNMKYHRMKEKLSQEQAAELCHISSKYWGKLERGEQAATIDTLEKIAAGLGISVTELLKEQGDVR